MSETTTPTVILNSPIEVVQHIQKRLTEDRFAHIEIKKYENKGQFESFYSSATLWYDTNTCGCKKKGLNQERIDELYKALKTMNDTEKTKAYRILGVPVELHFGGELIVKLP